MTVRADIFANTRAPVSLPDALLQYWPDAIAGHEHWLQRVQAETPWQQHQIRLYGRLVQTPRLACWMGDAGAAYRYSGASFTPQPWVTSVQLLRAQIEALTGHRFNSVLLNYYRNGRDSMGAHSDDEPELGPAPVIASLSLGADRDFVLQHRQRDLRHVICLAGGSVLLMAGQTQRYWRHSLPKRLRVHAPRINLTFRQVLAQR